LKPCTKIYIRILIISLTTLSVSSYYLTSRSHLDNISREQERSLNEFSFLISSLENGIDYQVEDNNQKLLYSHYAEYYSKRGIHLLVYRDNEPFYSNFTSVSQSKYQRLLSVHAGTRQVQVIKDDGCHYFFVTGRSTKANDYVFVYVRDISYIYQFLTQSIYLTLLFAAVLILVISLLFYLYSSWIIKPNETLNI